MSWLQTLVRATRRRRTDPTPVALPGYTVDELVKAGLYDIYTGPVIVPARCPCPDCQPDDES